MIDLKIENTQIIIIHIYYVHYRAAWIKHFSWNYYYYTFYAETIIVISLLKHKILWNIYIYYKGIHNTWISKSKHYHNINVLAPKRRFAERCEMSPRYYYIFYTFMHYTDIYNIRLTYNHIVKNQWLVNM